MSETMCAIWLTFILEQFFFFLLSLFIFWRANKNRRQLSIKPILFVMRWVNEYRNPFEVYCSKYQSTPNTQVNIRNFGEKKKNKQTQHKEH